MPKHKFQPIEGPIWPIYKRLLRYVTKYWFIFIIAILSSAAYSGVDAMLIRMIQPLMDEGFVARDPSVIGLIPILLPLFFLVRGLMSFLSNYSMYWLSRKIIMVIRQELFAQFLKLPASFYDHQPSGELISKMTFNVDQIAKACTDAIIETARNIFLVLFLLGVMFSISWQLTLWFLLLGPVIYCLFHVANKLFRRYSHRVQQTMAQTTHATEENLLGYKVVRIFGGQAHAMQRFKSITEKNRQQEMKLALTKAISVPFIQFVAGLAVVLTLVVATQQAEVYALSAGGFAAMVGAMIALLKPVKDITSVSHKIQRGIAGAQSIFELLDTPQESQSGDAITQNVQGKVQFSQVNFAYNQKDGAALHDISFAVEPGQTVALVGHSGSGKTTLMHLLPRLYDGFSGQIMLDGMDIKSLRLDDLRQQIAMVSQHVTLFNESIAHNVAHGEDRYDEARVIEALKSAYALPFVENLPQGINTLIGQDGVLLSGGQRQRIAIARALYKDAPVLILDEATSALDTVSERQIQQALQTLMRNRTTFVIAHRLSTIENADKILVLDKGKLIESGTHQSLLNNNGLYATLYQMQFKAADNHNDLAGTA